jgi:hypothetical protein
MSNDSWEAPEQITPQWVDLALDQLGQMTGDPEHFHVMEDGLYLTVLQAIAEGRCDNSQLCAEMVLEAREIDCARWYA